MSKLKKVLITGANGLLGQYLVTRFKKDYYVVACDLMSENYNILNPPQEYHSIDLTNRTKVRKLLGDQIPDIIINAAAFTNVDNCEDQRELCWATNVKSIELMVETFTTFAPLFVHISTDYIFNGKSAPYREDDHPKPLGYYGLTKYSSEKVVRASHLEYIIARTQILYGSGQRIRPNFVTWVIDQLKNNNEIQVVTDQKGNPTYADDLAYTIYRLIKKEEYGIFHISGRESCSRYEFACKIADIFKLDHRLIKSITTEHLMQKALRPEDSTFVLDKLSNRLDWLPGGLEESLRRMKLELS
jgi:dTDP-4-dehydrorhamnose reductase